MKPKSLQIALVVAVIGIIALVYFSGKNSTEKTVEFQEGASVAPHSDEWGFNIESAIEMELEKPGLSPLITELYPKGENVDTLTWLPVVARAWDSLGHGLFAGYYFEKLALKTGNADHWYFAGQRFFGLSNRTTDTFARRQISNRAIFTLEKTIALNPMNLRAKAELGVSYMENIQKGRSPMMGIGLLREVLQVDSLQVDALYYLGYLSMKSSQFDKAASRFRKLTQLQPDVPMYYDLLANAYAKLGKKEKAMKAMQTMAELLKTEEADKRLDEFSEALNAAPLHEQAAPSSSE